MRSILKIAFRQLARERRKAKCDVFLDMPSDNLPVSFASGRCLKRKRTGATLKREE